MTRLAAVLTLALSVSLHASEPRRDRFGDPLPPGAVARLGTIQAHPGASSIAFSPDGRTIITTGTTAVRHWDPETGRVRSVRTFPANIDEVRQAFSADGRVVVTVGGGGVVEVREVERDRVIHRIAIARLVELCQKQAHPEAIGVLEASPAGDLILLRLAKADGTLAIRGRKVEAWPGVTGAAVGTKFSADGKWVAIKCEDAGEIAVGPTADGCLHRFSYCGEIRAVAPDGSQLLVTSGSPDAAGRVTEVVDARTGKPVPGWDFKPKPMANVQTGCFSPDGRLLAIATTSEVYVCDVATKRVLWRVPGVVRHLAFAPDSRRLAGIEHLLRVWDAGTGKALTPDFGPLSSELIRWGAPRDGRVITQELHAGRFHVWDWTTGTPLFTGQLRSDKARSSSPRPIDGHDVVLWLSPDGRLVHSADHTHLRTWDIAGRRLVREHDPTPADLAPAKWELAPNPVPSPCGGFLSMVFVQEPEPNTKCLFLRWDLAAEKLVERREHSLPEFELAVLLPDSFGVALIQKDFTSFRFFDARNGRERREIATLNGPKRDVLFDLSIDGRFQVFFVGDNPMAMDGQPGEMVVVDSATGRPVHQFPSEGWIHTSPSDQLTPEPQAFSPDGRWWAIGRRDGIELWDLVERKSVPFHPPHRTVDISFKSPSLCEGLLFLSNQHLLAQYSDRSALVWELPPAARTPPSASVTATTWADLASDDPHVALRAVWALKHDAKAGLALLRRVKSVAAPDEKVLIAHFAELGSEQFSARDAATRRLRATGHTAERFLTTALATSAISEQRRRGRQLVEALQSDRPVSLDEWRALRAVQAAELIGGDAGRSLLAEWAKGDATAILTREAKAALQR